MSLTARLRPLDELVEILVSRYGPVHPNKLVELLAENGTMLGTDAEDQVLTVLEADDHPYTRLVDGSWIHVSRLLGGRLLTHRVTAAEIEHDLLASAPDFDLLIDLVDVADLGRFVDGTRLELIFPESSERGAITSARIGGADEEGSFALPSGSLTALGVGPGDLVGVRLGEHGIEVVAVDEPAPDPEVLDELADTLGSLLDPEIPRSAEEVLATLLVEAGDRFVTPLPPLGELLEVWDVARVQDMLAAPGFDVGSWALDDAASRLRLRHELDADEARALAVLAAVYELTYLMIDDFTDGDVEEDVPEEDLPASEVPVVLGALDADTVRAAVQYLADPYVARTARRELRYGTELDAPALGAMAEDLEKQADRAARPALLWLQAQALDELGDLDAAERVLRRAELLNRTWPPVIEDLARLASDRGDAAAGLALLDRLEDDEAPILRALLQDHRAAPAQTLPRNAPCWCGSGKKFKQCHLRQAGPASMPDRVDWLYGKAMVHLATADWVHRLRLVTMVRSRYVASAEEGTALLEDDLAYDAVLFEGGGLEDFLDKRGRLLPADEYELAQRWLDTERSLFEVVEVVEVTGRGSAVTVTLRDVRTGDQAVVAGLDLSSPVGPGTYICTHLLPDGGGGWLMKGLDPVRLHERDALLALLDDDESQPDEIVAFLTRRFAPPTLVNTEGEPLALRTLRIRTPEPGALAAALDVAYEGRDVDDRGVISWSDLVDVHGEKKVRAFLSLDGDVLTVLTNSEQRQAHVARALEELQPELELLSNEHESVPHPGSGGRSGARPAPNREAVGAFGQPLVTGSLVDQHADDPQVRAAILDHIRGYEERWTELEIPALDGLTPRQAAADPTRRDDLIRLLATFPAARDETDMDPQRLRELLGL